MPNPLLIIYLDRYHMGDPLFLQRLARELAKRQRPSSRCMIVHGSGEHAERVLEGEGLFPERSEGVLKVEGEAADLVERGIRDFNRQLVAVLTNEVVSCVSVQGASRNLLSLHGGELRVHRAGWVEAMLRHGVLPVVSALAVDAGRERAVEVPASQVVTAFGRAFEELEPLAVFFTRTERPGLLSEGEPVSDVDVIDLPGEDALPEPDAVRRVAEAGLRVVLTDPRALGEDGEVAGTHVQVA